MYCVDYSKQNNMRTNNLVIIILIISCLTNHCAYSVETLNNQDFSNDLDLIRKKFDLPSLAAVVVDSTGVRYIDAKGRRSIESDEKVTINDKYHLGSNTKSMTATLYAKLVEEGIFSWESNINDYFKEYRIHSKYSLVRFEQLLRHQAGITNNIPNSYPKLWSNFFELQRKDKTIAQRILLTKTILSDAPLFEIGKDSHYSNASIAIVGHAIEKRMNEKYEVTLRRYLFSKLGMKSCGFGTPGNVNSYTQPRGHLVHDGKIISISPGNLSDNPDAISPAGKVHCSIEDWGKYIQEHLKGKLGISKYLNTQTYAKLHNALKGQQFGLGWVNIIMPWLSSSPSLFHNGSNTMNYAEMWISAENNTGIGVVTNLGGDSARKAVREMSELIANKYMQIN